MNAPDWQRLEELFHHAVELPPTQRESFLADQCAEDAALRREVLELLEADQAPATTWTGLRLPANPPPPSLPGYGPLQPVGSGGMGTVYRGHSSDPMLAGKTFAVKVLHAHRLSSSGRAQFENERRLLAALDHPHIVKLYDGGELADGRPFLVMDFVRGLPLDQYCRRRRATLRQRLDIFRSLCKAVHHAHQNLVVHRDLKPSNMLVDEDGHPRLVDFGIAKLLDMESHTTTQSPVPMTPAYAAPEQRQGRSATTAGDIYSLGLVLFELLTDHLPTPEDCEPLPPRPSRRLADPEGTLADDRRTTLSELRRQLRQDLDHIVMKALQKHPDDRYASAQELADDLERFQKGLPVVARQDNRRYWFWHFLRRHRGNIAASLIAFSALGITAGSRWDNQRRISEMEDVFRLSLAPEEFQMAKGTWDRTVDLILQSSIAKSEKAVLFEALRSISVPEEPLFGQVEQLMAGWHPGDQNLVELGLIFGESLFHENRFEASESILDQVARLAEGTEDGERDLATALELHGRTLADLERFAEARAKFDRSREIREGLVPSPELALPEIGHGVVSHMEGDYPRTVADYRSALEILERFAETDPMQKASVLTGLSVGLCGLDSEESYAEAEAHAVHALEINEAELGLGHMNTLQARNNLGMVFFRQGRLDEAIEIAEQNLREGRQTQGRDHPILAHIHTALAGAHRKKGQFDLCAEHGRRAVELRVGRVSSWKVGFSQATLALCLAQSGATLEAIYSLRAGLELMEGSEMKDPKVIPRARSELAVLYWRMMPR